MSTKENLGKEGKNKIVTRRSVFWFIVFLILITTKFIFPNGKDVDGTATNSQNASKQESLIPVEWGSAYGTSSVMLGVMASGYSNWMIAPYATVMVAAENKTEKANPNPELHMFTFHIPTTLKVCQKDKEVSMGVESVDANGVALQAEVECSGGKKKYYINEKSIQGSPTPLDTMFRKGKVRMSFSSTLTFPSLGYAAWVDNKLAEQYVEQAKKDKENLRLNKFYAMHEDKVNDAQENLTKIFWCEDMGYSMNQFIGLAGKMQNFSVKHSHPVALSKNRDELKNHYNLFPRSVAGGICSTAGITRYTY
jgi:hypothetical protein